MRQRATSRKNWPWSAKAAPAVRRRGGAAVGLAAAAKAARAAGYREGEHKYFSDWLADKGFDDRSESVKLRLGAAYAAGITAKREDEKDRAAKAFLVQTKRDLAEKYKAEAREQREEERKERASKPKRLSSYGGYILSKTSDGSYFSSLDSGSWYDSLAQVKRSIDDYKAGRSNPKRKNILPLNLIDLYNVNQLGKGIKGRVMGKRNPEDGAAAMSESFHGRPVEEIIEVEEQVHYHSHLAELGKLRKLKIKALDGGVVSLTGFDGALLCSNEDGSQLYILGGDQSVELSEFAVDEPYHDYEDLGEVIEIRYYTTKDHLGKEGGEATYFHHFGEEDKAAGRKPRRPRLRASVRDNRLSFVGGAYVVKPEGIAN